MQTNCKALAKLVQNKKLNTLRLLVTFDTSKKNKDGDTIITASNAVFASGDLTDEKDVLRSVKQAKDVLRVNTLYFV